MLIGAAGLAVVATMTAPCYFKDAKRTFYYLAREEGKSRKEVIDLLVQDARSLTLPFLHREKQQQQGR
jgi:hypothetical protein